MEHIAILDYCTGTVHTYKAELDESSDEFTGEDIVAALGHSVDCCYCMITEEPIEIVEHEGIITHLDKK